MPATDALDGDTDLDLLIRAARHAGPIALRQWRQDPRVWTKDDRSPVTAADLDVDAALKDLLRAARPGYGWLSEESDDDPARLRARRCFVVDPIDGTRAFIAGETHWSHSLAVVEDGRPTAAVVFLPAEAKLYAAASGRGATLEGRPIAVSPRREIAGATLLAAKAALQLQHWARLPEVERRFRPSLAYRLALVAEGAFDAMFTPRATWDWDIAAGSLLVAEAGGTVTSRTGAPLAFNTPARQNPGTLAAGPLHGGLLARLL